MMDKEKAIQIIHEEYQNGFSPTDIAQNMSEQLGAPFELVYKFVMKTLDEKVEIGEPAAAMEPIPPPAPPPESEPISPPFPGYEPVPVFESAPVFEPVSSHEPVEDFELVQGYELLPEEAVTPDYSADGAVGTPAFAVTPAPDLKALEQNPKVEKFVLQMLSSNRKTSDTVLAVCERTGLGWDEAQRLVARIAAKNHKTLKSKRNRLPMILSIIALLAGALMIFGAISEAYNIYTVVQRLPTGEEMLIAATSQEYLRSALWSLLVGGALLLGGTAGLFIALRAQFE